MFIFQPPSASKTKAVDPTADLFDDDDDDMLIEATNPVVGGPCDVGDPESDDDADLEVDIGALKKRIMGVIDDDDDNSKGRWYQMNGME